MSTNHFCDISVEKEVDKKINVAKNKKTLRKNDGPKYRKINTFNGKKTKFQLFLCDKQKNILNIDVKYMK